MANQYDNVIHQEESFVYKNSDYNDNMSIGGSNVNAAVDPDQIKERTSFQEQVHTAIESI